MSLILVDSYSESHATNTRSIYSGGKIAIGQSITGDGNLLNNAVFYLGKIGSPTGYAYAKIYAHSGTFGVSSLLTGAALATSEALDVSTLSSLYQLIIFNFTGANKITLENEVHYIVTLEYSGGDINNYILVTGLKLLNHLLVKQEILSTVNGI